jgi:hypothetical protein
MRKQHFLQEVTMAIAVLGWASGAITLPSVTSTAVAQRPDFIPTVRAYGGAGFDDFQRQSMKELGLSYVQGLVDFTWDHIQRGDDAWKWIAADEQMDKLAQAGLKVIGFFICPKSPGLPWDESVRRDDPKFAARYGEFAYQVVHRYHRHPAWSGLAAVWGGSADVWDHNHALTDPEVVVPLLNAAYEGIKRADPKTIVIGFNFATTAHSIKNWEEYHRRAFACKPKFDWYGVQSHGLPATWLESPGAYTGVAGLLNVRKFLEKHGYADKPLWLNEGGFRQGEDLGGLPEPTHAEQVVESYIVGRTLGVNLKGWVYFEYFSKTHRFEDGADMGLLSALDEHNPPQPRQAWLALRTLIKTVRFFDHEFDRKISGEYNRASPPFVYRFLRRRPSGSNLWVVFSPWGRSKQQPVVRRVEISIAPASRATLITMLGNQSTLHADSSGKVALTSTSSPTYVIAER